MAENEANTQQVEQQPQTETPTTGTGQTKTETEAPRTFTQEEVNKFLGDERRRERAKFADYDDLKTKAARLQEIEDANKTEAQKQADKYAAIEAQLAELKGQNARLVEERVRAVMHASVAAAAMKEGFVDPDDAWAFVDTSALKVDESGKVTGVDEAIKALAKAKPHLLRKQAQLGPTNPGKGGAESGETDAQRRARLNGYSDSPFGRSHGGGLVMPTDKP